MNKERDELGRWLDRIIEGCGGMNDYERHEMVAWNEPERIAAARWTIECLCNAGCEGSGAILDKIIAARKRRVEASNDNG